MKALKRTPQAAAATDLIFEIFRAHGALVALGDRMVAGLGLSTARWQVLGSIGEKARDQSVAMIARNLGLSRQAVQRVVNELVRDGLAAYAPNPHHKRAKLVRMTEKGLAAYLAADGAFFAWANAALAGLDVARIAGAWEVTKALRQLCEGYVVAPTDPPPTDSPSADPSTNEGV
jgi:DNA-binding MarR family transcriptional regulator